ncbi:MAG: rRNA pseudouridine synthase [Pedosphaera sp.]|nr:rRNA pseudouridine synthase [Pedosphaera sp.]
MPIRLQKFLAEAGVASRRASERLIMDGEVKVNGRVVTELGTKVDAAHDQVIVGGTPVSARRKLYVALNKPRGFLCTRSDPEQRNVVGDLLPREWENLFTVGRLDRESEGLIFLTNDGEFGLKLTHPRYNVRKTYVAVVEGRVSGAALGRFTAGIEEAGDLLKAEKARLVSANNSHSIVEVELAQGKNREVRRLFQALGHQVVELCRVQIGPIKLGELKSGKWRVMTPAELKSLLRGLA